jgi:Ras family protein
VTTAEGDALAKKLKAAFVESSAKDNKNVGEYCIAGGLQAHLTRPGKAFEVLLGEMQREYNPAPEKKKAGWFSWGK